MGDCLSQPRYRDRSSRDTGASLTRTNQSAALAAAAILLPSRTVSFSLLQGDSFWDYVKKDRLSLVRVPTDKVKTVGQMFASSSARLIWSIALMCGMEMLRRVIARRFFHASTCAGYCR